MGMVDQPSYLIRFFFDPGSGVCFWAGNDAARERFDYPILPELLPLSESTRQAVASLIEKYEGAVDMLDPVRPNWDDAEAALFAAEVQRVLATVESELGSEFLIQRA